ncbi:MAG: flagellar M-ring protein FliF [Zetaproteobacteria bacterium]|nr:flagellar M-ring protein FliF [Zetaproteobacteria bacterium]
MADNNSLMEGAATGVVTGGGGFRDISARENRKWLLMLAVLLVVVGLVSLSYWSVEPEYKILYSGLSDQDASSITQGLEKSAIPYRLDSGGTILVPAEKLYDARLQIAGENLAPSGGTGFELFDDSQSFALSEFSQNINYQRALQGELARTIEVIPQVNKARVHLVFAKESAFVKKSQVATASVMLRLKGNVKLSESSVKAIQNLVASSVAQLEPKQVTVVDSSGNLLSADKDEKSSGQNGQSFTDRQQELQQRMEREVRTMLEQTVGIGQAVVRVNVDLNREYFEMKKRSYNPESVLRSEKTISENRSSGDQAGGVPGEQAALGIDNGSGTGEGSKDRASRNERTANFEIGESDEHRIVPGGDIKRLSVAVMVGGRIDEKGEFQPRDAQEMKGLRQIVMRSVGYDEDRGDLIELQSVPLMSMDNSKEDAELKAAEDRVFMITMVKYALLGLALILFALFVLRPLIGRLAMGGSMSGSGDGLGGDLSMRSEAEDVIKNTLSAKQVVASSAAQRGAMEIVNQIATEDPEKTASIMRKWLEEGSEPEGRS